MFRSGAFNNFNYGIFRKNPTWFGVPLVLLIVAASFGLEKLTRTRYEVHARKVTEVINHFLLLTQVNICTLDKLTEEERLRLHKNRKKIDLREEYFVSLSIRYRNFQLVVKVKQHRN